MQLAVKFAHVYSGDLKGSKQFDFGTS